MIAVLQIGNSDNKLTQNEWSHFVHGIQQCVAECGIEIHFFGTSQGDAPWQNACWVCSVIEPDIDKFQEEVTRIRKSFRQDSVAVVIGDVRSW